MLAIGNYERDIQGFLFCLGIALFFGVILVIIYIGSRQTDRTFLPSFKDVPSL